MSLPPLFVELVAGPPATGKSTYLEAKRQLLVATTAQADISNADRHLIHVNLDPANDGVFPYPCAIDICDLIEVKCVAEQEHLGPNGSYLFCIEYLGQNTDWLINKMINVAKTCARNDRANMSSSNNNNIKKGAGGGGGNGKVKPVWFMMDCPGQVEFYVHSTGLATLVRDLTKKLRAQVCLTHLCDSVVATRDVFSYVSTSLLCLTTMTDVELPQVNVLTKWDLAVEQAKDTISLAKAARERKRRSEQARQARDAKRLSEKKSNINNNDEVDDDESTDAEESHQGYIDAARPQEVDDDEVDNWLEPFCNASVFSSDHFESMWADTQMDHTIKAQVSSRSAMLQRCGGSGAKRMSNNSTFDAVSDNNCNNNNNNNNNILSNNNESDKKGDQDPASSSVRQQHHHSFQRDKKGPLHALTKAALGVVEGYNLVGYIPLDVQNGEMMRQLCMDIDNAIGFSMHTAGT